MAPILGRTRTEVFESANILEVTVEHNGYQGGDAGHGGYVKITFYDQASTCMAVNGNECENFEIVFRGDSERDTLLAGLKMIVKELEENTESYPIIKQSHKPRY